MMIIQFQITNFNEEEINNIYEFCNWLKEDIISKYIYNHESIMKIENKLKNLNKVSWIKWKRKSQKVNNRKIIDLIKESIKITVYRNNIYKLETNSNILIPNSYTSMDRLIRYINSGDNATLATNIFTNIQQDLNHSQLNALWRYYILKEFGYFTDSKLVTKIG